VLVRQELRYVEPRLLTVDETARLLIQHLALVVTPRVLRLVHEQSRGNPLFALEVGRVLVERGIPGIGEPLGVPEEMATMLGLRVRDLPEDQRTLLLAVALDPHVREDALVKLVGLGVVEAAVRDRLVTVSDGGRVRAWHPLLAAAAREGATPARQRQLHLRLAELESHPESRARHLARGATETSEELAEVLSKESATAAARGAVESGVELAELALARSPQGSPQRAQRVLDLASRLAAAGEGQGVTDFLTREIESLPVGRDRGTAWLMMLDGIVGSMANVERFIDHALAECGDDAEVRAQALDMKALIHVGMLVSGVSAARAWADEAVALGTGSGQGRDWCLVHSGLPPEGPDGIPHIKRHVWRGEPAKAEPQLREAIAAAEAEGQLRESMSLRLHLLDLLTRSGRVDEARAVLAVLEDADLGDKESPDEELLHAVIEVQSGDVAEARRWASIACDAARDFGHTWLYLESVRVTGIAELMEGRLDEAERCFRQAWEWVARAEVRDPNIFPLAPELVESLVLLGRYDDAREVIAWLRERAEEQAHPWGVAMTARSEHLLGLVDGTEPVDEAEPGMTAAAERFDELGLAVDAARTRLSLGSALRRRKQWGRARQALEQAQAGFEATGAEGWAELARSELAKVGGRKRSASSEDLTPAEEATARLAADGLSNKEIARRTNVSIHTVEVHLSRTYAKLGIRSRSQIAARLPS
jgi:DNA-binding CsgD family transcriptional regulator